MIKYLVSSCYFFVVIAFLSAYQWPAEQKPAASFLQQQPGKTAVNLGISFNTVKEAKAYASGEIIYLQRNNHPKSLPTANRVELVLQYEDWLISYHSEGMARATKLISSRIPIKVSEGQMLLKQQQKEAKLYVEFYDRKNKYLVSPWLMLPERESLAPAINIVASQLESKKKTRLLRQSYLRPGEYSLLLSVNRLRTPNNIAVSYDNLQLGQLDLSTVEQRDGLLYTNTGLNPLMELFNSATVKIATLAVTGPLRKWHKLQIKANFDSLKELSREYSIYTLPPPKKPLKS